MVIDDQTGLWRPGQGQGRDNSLSIVTIQHEQGQHVIVANRQTDGQVRKQTGQLAGMPIICLISAALPSPIPLSLISLCVHI